jgi:hypothetical protein
VAELDSPTEADGIRRLIVKADSNPRMHVTLRCRDLLRLSRGKAEFFQELSRKSFEYEFGSHQLLMHQQIFQQIGPQIVSAI